MRHFCYLIACVFVLATASACQLKEEGNPLVPPGAKSSGGQRAVIETNHGEIEIKFFEAEAPRGVENFRLLAEHGYYDNTPFHRIVRGFMIQGGDPTGTGRGGESAWGTPLKDEIQPDSPLYRGGYKRGLVAYANSGPNTSGSQFFIMHQDYPLDPNYTIFAWVTKGMEVVDAIAAVETTMGADGNMSSPTSPQIIKKVTIKP